MSARSPISFSLIFVLFITSGFSQNSPANAGNGNPLLPGYFADPTIRKFGDTWYIYSTTDGIKLASGEPTVWISKDFQNWFNYKIDLQVPDGLTNCWAPDVFRGKDGKYYYFMGNCQFGCNIYGYVSDSPMGPFLPINRGEPVIPAGTSKKNLPALDAQFLIDDDGSVYAYFGTWCTSFGGMGYVKVDPADMHTILKAGFIPIDQIPKAFEAAYPLKKDGNYFLMYSVGDCRLSSYAVHYSVSSSPEGPFVPGKNNPILETNGDGTVDGPGHHSILKEGDDYYMVYHRHDNPHSTNGEFRQVCIDKLIFSDKETIEKVVPTHSGVKLQIGKSFTIPDLALKAKVKASSFYHLKSRKTVYSPGDYNYKYLPEHAVDENNGTLWKAASADFPQTLVVDLGQTASVKRVMTEFEYPTFYYQYKIETSADSVHWSLFADKTANRRCGSPMIDDNNMDARFVKLTLTGTEKPGMLAAVWNIRVYDSVFEVPAFRNKESLTGPGIASTKSLLVDFNTEKLTAGKVSSAIPNKTKFGGTFIPEGKPSIKTIDGVNAMYFDGQSSLRLSKKAPASLNWNSAFTASAWVFNPELAEGECLLVWNTRENMLQSSYAALMYGTSPFGAMAHGDGAVDLGYKKLPEKEKWHHITVTFDGVLENIYVDGKLDNQQPIMLYVETSDILIGTSGEPAENFTGYIARAQLFDKALSATEVLKLMKETTPKNLK